MALKNVSTTNNALGVAQTHIGGCNASIIGMDVKTIHKTAGVTPRTDLALNTTFALPMIGGVTAQAVEDTNQVAGKALRLQAAVAGVAIDGVVANTYLNKTGKALVAGDVVLAVAP
jgi:hypothetical protein